MSGYLTDGPVDLTLDGAKLLNNRVATRRSRDFIHTCVNNREYTERKLSFEEHSLHGVDKVVPVREGNRRTDIHFEQQTLVLSALVGRSVSIEYKVRLVLALLNELLLLFVVAYPGPEVVNIDHLTEANEPRVIHALCFGGPEEVKPKDALKYKVPREDRLRRVFLRLAHLVDSGHTHLINHRLIVHNSAFGVIPVHFVSYFTNTDKVLHHFAGTVAPAVAVLNITPYSVVKLGGFLVLKLVVVLRERGNARSIREDVVLVDFANALNMVNRQPNLLLFREPLVVPNAVPEPRAFTSIVGTSYEKKVRSLLCIQMIVGVFAFFVEPNQFRVI